MNSLLKNTLLLIFCAITIVGYSQEQLEETDQQKRMAQMMAETMDHLWDQAPEDGTGNIQILMTKDGVAFSLPASIHGKFTFIGKKGHQQTLTAFNPNKNGRWVNEGMEPGTYDITIKGLKEFEGKNWEFNNFELTENGIITLKLEL